MNGNKLNWRQRASLAAGLAIVGAGSASAALPVALTSALDSAQADAILAVAAVGAMVILVAVAAVAWRIGVKGIKRIGGAA